MKKLAQTMLMKIKARIHELDHWRDKEETQSIISNVGISRTERKSGNVLDIYALKC